LRKDTRILKRGILPAFGAELPARKLTGAAIAQYDRQRAGQVSAFTVANELTVLLHMLRLARKWGYIEQVPDIERPKKPGGRPASLDEAQIAKLLDACGRSRNPYLAAIVTVALNTGMRKAEILGLEWERIDLSSARLTLYKTKSGKPRGVPINRAVYDTLIALESDAERRAVSFNTRICTSRSAWTGTCDGSWSRRWCTSATTRPNQPRQTRTSARCSHSLIGSFRVAERDGLRFGDAHPR
jgi:integrase